MQYSIVTFEDSKYLIESNRQKCVDLLNKDNLNENDIIDIYISLHLILEVSLNAFHREIITSRIIKPIDKIEIIKNIDNIGFMEKTALFIYNAQFNFGCDIDQTIIHHKIIAKLKQFSGIRNKLIHGHSIGSLKIDNNITQNTEVRKSLQIESLNVQLKLFTEINKGMQFFLDHLVTDGWSEGYLNDLKKKYLQYDFIPENYLV